MFIIFFIGPFIDTYEPKTVLHCREEEEME